MKTTFSPEEINQKLHIENAQQLTEGHISQAFRFESENGDNMVLRLADYESNFKADRYAYEHFGHKLLVPKVHELGKFGTDAYYCISEFVDGTLSDKLTPEELHVALPDMLEVFAKMYCFDISSTKGYGNIQTESGNGPKESWKDWIISEIEKTGLEKFKVHAQGIGLDEDIAVQFYKQFIDTVPAASEVRRLIHGDPSFDNVIVKNGKVVAVIDWAQMAYGDWMSDFARMEFWWPGRHGSDTEFAEKFGLDSDHMAERKALYFATNALSTIEFADNTQHAGVTTWLHDYLPGKLL